MGRPNVGKSTLFNRLLRKNKSIVHDAPGVTRDRVFGEVTYVDHPFALIDTGGLVLDDPQGLEVEILDQTSEAIELAHVLVLVVDVFDGLTATDQAAVELVRQSGKPVLLVANKVDGPEREPHAAEFHTLGLPMIAVSSAHGFGIGGLLETLEKLAAAVPLDELPEVAEESVRGLRIAMLGRPNAGKSSMVNAILGQNRLIVSPHAGTTRDCVDVTVESGGKTYTFVDTAGVRRKAKIDDTLERYSVLRALRTSSRADVTVLVLEADTGLLAQDKKLIAYLAKEGVPFLVAVNKMDLVARPEQRELKQDIKDSLAICPHAPVIYVSALKKQGLSKILPLAEKIHAECSIRIPTGQLNRIMREATEGYQPPSVKNRRPKFYYLTQTEAKPPTFVIFVNDPELIRQSYARYLENRLRKSFGIEHAPIRLTFRPSGGKWQDR